MQKFSSKNTSINSKKLPAVFKKINLSAFSKLVILDYGAGKHTDIIRKWCGERGIWYYAYDPYNGSDEGWDRCNPDLVVCSNVLNVIDDDTEVQRIHDYIRGLGVPYMITVYEGDGSGQGKPSGEDSYQRNQKLGDYMLNGEIKRKSVITKSEYKHFIK